MIVGFWMRVAGQLWLLVLVGYVQQVVIFDFVTEVPGKGVGHYLGSYKSEGKESVSW